MSGAENPVVGCTETLYKCSSPPWSFLTSDGDLGWLLQIMTSHGFSVTLELFCQGGSEKMETKHGQQQPLGALRQARASRKSVKMCRRSPCDNVLGICTFCRIWI